MGVLDAINKGKQTNQTAKQLYMAKMFNRPISITGIMQFFTEQLQCNGFGQMAPISKENKGKINGFIKFLQNNGFTSQEIYEFLQKCIENWQQLLSTDIHTDNRKKYNLDTVPNLIDIIHCKTQIFRELNKEVEEVDDDNFDIWAEFAKD